MISIFTPTHDPSYLRKVYASLQSQTDADWEWLVLHNGASRPIGFSDLRVREEVAATKSDWVGPLKAEAVERARGDALLELDHDDLLLPTAVARVKQALDGNERGFVYSNALHCDAGLGPEVQRYGEEFGWRSRDTEFAGRKLYEPLSFDPSPASVARIWYAPNHLRAFTRSLYEDAGGYSTKMRVLDDQDLMCRMYERSDFTHIDEALYVYRIHGGNAWLKHNQEIQSNVMRIYDQYIERMALAWATRSGLRKLELGGAFNSHEGYETVDLKNAAVLCDLEGNWPFADNSVGVIRAADILEHLRDPLHTMKECYRVLAPGGMLFAAVPSTDGRGAFQDPTHKSFWNENSWLYYTNKNWARYIDTPVRFQAVRRYTTEKDKIGVCWTMAHLISLKNGYRPPGYIAI